MTQLIHYRPQVANNGNMCQNQWFPYTQRFITHETDFMLQFYVADTIVNYIWVPQYAL